MKILTGVVSDIGIEKDTNQDSAIIKVGESDNKTICFAAVCDGMGGLAKGELASAHVVRHFSEWCENKLQDFIEKDDWTDSTKDDWNKRIKELNNELNNYAKSIRANLGTTITAVLLINNHYICVNVGDSRLYKLNKIIMQITEDQSLVAREVRLGKLRKEDAESDSRRNVLLQCIGATRDVLPDFYEGELQPGEAILLCSDGFRHEISEEEMLEGLAVNKLTTDTIIEEKIRSLVETVKARGESDNITAMLIKLV